MNSDWAITIFSVCIPLSVVIWKWVPRRRDDVATWKEVQHLREDLTLRLDVMQRDINRIAHKVGLDIWGS